MQLRVLHAHNAGLQGNEAQHVVSGVSHTIYGVLCLMVLLHRAIPLGTSCAWGEVAMLVSGCLARTFCVYSEGTRLACESCVSGVDVSLGVAICTYSRVCADRLVQLTS